MNYDPGMKTSASLAALAAVVMVPALASAQPSSAPPPSGGYYSQPPQPVSPYHHRAGTPMIGFGLGLGGMEIGDRDVECSTCDYEPIGVEADFHIGGMLSERFALMLELQANAETVDDSIYGTTTLTQGVAMIAGQYWVSPRLWIKGGIGAAHLAYEYDDYYGAGSEPVDDGAAIMGAIGYEVIATRGFGLDLQGRIISASYDGIDDNVTAATIGLGLSWYGWGAAGGGALIVVP